MRLPILASILAVATSCSAPPAAPLARPLAPPPALQTSTDARFGRALAAGVATKEGVDVASAPGPRRFAKVVLALLAAPPRADGERLVDALAVVADPAASGTVRLPSTALEPARLWRGAAARELFAALRAEDDRGYLALATFEEPLVAGFTSWFAAGASERFDDRRDFLREQNPPQSVERRFALAVDADANGDVHVTLERGSAGFDGELAKLAAPLQATAGPLLLMVPTPFTGGHGSWCAAWLELEEVAAEAPAAAGWHARAQEWVAREQARRSASGAVALLASERLLAWRGLRVDPASRTALVWLTARLPESFSGDLAVTTDDEQLVQLLRDYEAQRATGPAPADDVELDEQLERGAIGWLARLATVGDLPPELASVVARRAGALGAYPTLLAELARAPGGLAALAERLIAENVQLLEESSASLRVRAYDWLAQRGAAPEGFDPLAPLAERRAALIERAAAMAGRADG